MKIVLRLLLCIICTSFVINASASNWLPQEKGRLCDEYVYKFAFPSGQKFKPTITQIISTLGYGINETAYTHKYFWKDLEVMFLNGKYIDHAGFLHLDKISNVHHNITPDDVIAYHGKPMKVKQHHNKMKIWHCHPSVSKLGIIFNDANQISRYDGRYCSHRHSEFCKDFIYSIREK